MQRQRQLQRTSQPKIQAPINGTHYKVTKVQNEPQSIVMLQKNNQFFLGLRPIVWVTINSISDYLRKQFYDEYRLQIMVVQSIEICLNCFQYQPHDIWVSDLSTFLQIWEKVYNREQVKGIIFYDISPNHQDLEGFDSIRNQLNLSSKLKFATDDFNHIGQRYKTEFGVSNFKVVNEHQQNLGLIATLKGMIYQKSNRKQIIQFFCQVCQLNGFEKEKSMVLHYYEKNNFLELDQTSIFELYQKQSMFYRILNKILRTSNSPQQTFIIQPFFQDLFKAIKKWQFKNRNSQGFLCYRGGVITNDELEKLKPGIVVQSFGFFSASTNKKQAKKFIINALFQIEVDSTHENQIFSQGFVKPSNVSTLSKQAQVIFNPLTYFVVADILLPDQNHNFIQINLKYGEVQKIIKKHFACQLMTKQQENISQLILAKNNFYKHHHDWTQIAAIGNYQAFSLRRNVLIKQFVDEYKNMVTSQKREQNFRNRLKELQEKTNLFFMYTMGSIQLNNQLGQICLRTFQQFYQKFFSNFNCKLEINESIKQLQQNIMKINHYIIEDDLIFNNELFCPSKDNQTNNENRFIIQIQSVYKLVQSIDDAINSNNGDIKRISDMLKVQEILHKHSKLLLLVRKLYSNDLLPNDATIASNESSKKYENMRILLQNISEFVCRYFSKLHNLVVKLKKHKCSQITNEAIQQLVIIHRKSIDNILHDECYKAFIKVSNLLTDQQCNKALQQIDTHFKQHNHSLRKTCTETFMLKLAKGYALKGSDYPFQWKRSELQLILSQLQVMLGKSSLAYQGVLGLLYKLYIENKIAPTNDGLFKDSLNYHQKILQRVIEFQDDQQARQIAKMVFELNFEKKNLENYLIEQDYKSYIKNMQLCLQNRKYLQNSNFCQGQYHNEVSRAPLICLITKEPENSRLFIKQYVNTKVICTNKKNILRFLQSLCCSCIINKQTPLTLNRYFEYITHIKQNRSLHQSIQPQKIKQIQQQFNQVYDIFKCGDQDMMGLVNNPAYYIVKLAQYVFGCLFCGGVPVADVQVRDIKFMELIIELGRIVFCWYEKPAVGRRDMKLYYVNFMDTKKHKDIQFEHYQLKIIAILKNVGLKYLQIPKNDKI